MLLVLVFFFFPTTLNDLELSRMTMYFETNLQTKLKFGKDMGSHSVYHLANSVTFANCKFLRLLNSIDNYHSHFV